MRDAFCVACGAELAAGPGCCAACGESLAPGDAFCSQCGTPRRAVLVEYSRSTEVAGVGFRWAEWIGAGLVFVACGTLIWWIIPIFTLAGQPVNLAQAHALCAGAAGTIASDLIGAAYHNCLIVAHDAWIGYGCFAAGGAAILVGLVGIIADAS